MFAARATRIAAAGLAAGSAGFWYRYKQVDTAERYPSYPVPNGLIASAQEQVQQPDEPQDAFKRAKIGHYENRLRFYAHPLKLFQYFASVQKGPREFYMTSEDFVRSLIPYRDAQAVVHDSHKSSPKAQELRQKAIKSALEGITKLADTNGDGLIDFDEYVFFLTLLSTPDHLFEIAFKILDQDGNQRLDSKEFAKVIDSHSSSIHARMGLKERPKRLTLLNEKQELTGLMANLFGKRGEQQLTIDQFRKIMKELKLDLLKCEFYQYETDEQGTMSMKDFACSVLTYTPAGDTKVYINRLESLPEFKERLTFDQYTLFDKVARQTDSLSLAMNLLSDIESTYPDEIGLNPKEFHRIVETIAGAKVPEIMIKVIYHVFDANGDGRLDSKEFVDAVKGRRFRGLNGTAAGEPSFVEGAKRLWNCIRNTIEE